MAWSWTSVTLGIMCLAVAFLRTFSCSVRDIYLWNEIQKIIVIHFSLPCAWHIYSPMYFIMYGMVYVPECVNMYAGRSLHLLLHFHAWTRFSLRRKIVTLINHPASRLLVSWSLVLRETMCSLAAPILALVPLDVLQKTSMLTVTVIRTVQHHSYAYYCNLCYMKGAGNSFWSYGIT